MNLCCCLYGCDVIKLDRNKSQVKLENALCGSAESNIHSNDDSMGKVFVDITTFAKFLAASAKQKTLSKGSEKLQICPTAGNCTGAFSGTVCATAIRLVAVGEEVLFAFVALLEYFPTPL